MVKIRLSRLGRKKHPHYRIIAIDSRSSRDGKYLDKIGHYHPLLPKDDSSRVFLDIDKYNKWISHGAQPTDVVKRLFMNVTQQKSS